MNGVLLLSGGMDSAALAHWIRPRFALTVDYGQVCAEAEVRAARCIAAEVSAAHTVLTVDLRALGIGRLAGMAPTPQSPTPEWWPFRNQLLVTLAAAHAIKCGADSVVIGTLSTDESHADGRSEFIDTLDRLLQLQEGSVRLVAPARSLDAVALARRSKAPRALLALTHSCHTGSHPCGRCRGCQKHSETFRELGWLS
jgi:7-cyano-7-deazaguanine synthase